MSSLENQIKNFMKALIIASFTLLSGACYGQISSEADSTRLNRTRKEQLLNNNKLSNGDHPLDRNSSLNGSPNRTEYSFEEDAEASDMHLSVPPFYIGPLSDDPNAPPRINQFSDDYSFYGRNKVMEGGWINTASSHTSFPALGSLTIIRANYEYMLSDKIITSVGVYGARYFYNLNMYQDFGINAALKYQINDRFALVGYGQYSARGNINNIGGDNAWMMPNTNFGVGAQYMFNKNFGVEGGVNRQLNPMTGQWKNIPYIIPVIRIR